MRITEENISLPEGHFNAKLQYFENTDRALLFSIYQNWRSLCNELNEINSRSVNLPEGLSEGAFSLEMGCARLVGSIPGANSSFDCYSTAENHRIQVKACSVLPDLTSFGPNSVWDKLYFCDFYREGRWDGKFDIYLIENYLIYNYKVNSEQTFHAQQAQRRRPRFSIYNGLIKTQCIEPLRTGDLSV